MSLMELGALGEFLGSVAVVVTLAFLAMQIRQSNRLAIASEVTAVTNRRIQLLDNAAMSKELGEVLANQASWPGAERMRERFHMDAEAFQRYHLHTMAMMAAWEHQYLSPISDVSGQKGGWRFKAEFGAWMANPINQAWWQEMKPVYHREFATAVDELIQQIRSSDQSILGADAGNWPSETPSPD